MKTIYETSAGGIVFRRGKTRKDNIARKNAEVLWLICRHSQHKGWVFPKGLVGDKDSTESMETAALREVQEEGGVKAKIVNNQPVKVEYWYWQTASAKASAVKVKKTVYYFLMGYISGDPKDHDWEMSEAKFVTEEEVKKTLTYKSDQEAFEKILKLTTTI